MVMPSAVYSFSLYRAHLLEKQTRHRDGDLSDLDLKPPTAVGKTGAPPQAPGLAVQLASGTVPVVELAV